MKTLIRLLVFLCILSTTNLVQAQNFKNELILDVPTTVALRAATLAAKAMPGPYSWSEYRSCSSFVSEYLRQLSFPVDGMAGQNNEYPNPFPWSNVVSQVRWFQEYYPSYLKSAPLDDFLSHKLWDQIKPGSLIYLQYPIGHNGYNTYYHVVILIGYHQDGSPQFAELAAGMSNASTERDFETITRFYSNHTKPVSVENNTPKSLIVTWVNPLAILNQGKLWLKSGVVQPQSLLKSQFDTVITVNIYNGTTAIFELDNQNRWTQLNLEGHSLFFAVTGRFLPSNSDITKAFFDKRINEIYDGDFGVYIKNSVYQHSWTPQLVAKISTITYISNFGGLNGSTDTTLPMPLIYQDNIQIGVDKDYSPFTVHRVPEVINQDILLRVDLLKAANNIDQKDFGPIAVPQVNLSSGCVNYDKDTWIIMKSYLLDQMKAQKRVGLVMSYPDFDQSLILQNSVFDSAFIGYQFDQWCTYNNSCDTFDRKKYRKTYLD